MIAEGRLARLFTTSVLCVALSSATARAEYHRRVLLLEHPTDNDSDRELLTRVRAELSAAGFEVIVLDVSEADPKQAVESVGHELHPASVLLIEHLPVSDAPGSGGVELWLADRMLRRTFVLRLKPSDSDGQELDPAANRSREAARVAVQAVELVKARLAELAVTREPSATAPPPPRPVTPPAPVERGLHPNLTLAVGLLDGFEPGQVTLTPVLRLGLVLPERWTGPVLALELRGGFVGLGRAARIEQGPAAATVRHTAANLDAVMRFLPKMAVQPWLSLGAGFLALDVAGVAPDPYRNHATRTLSGLVAASAGLWLRPLPNFGLALEGQLMNAWSKTVVRIAGEDAGEVAAPLLLLSSGAMVEF
jgi:hypothetical protein